MTGPATSLRGRWALTGLLMAALLATLGVSFAATIDATVSVWANSATYNHGFLIAPIACWLIWRDRDSLSAATPAPWPWAVPLIAGGSLLWLAGHIVTFLELQQFAVVMMIITSVVALLGLRISRVLWFALAYLIFLVPTGEWLVPWLQNVTAKFAIATIELIGIPVYGDGIVIEIPAGRFVVAEACAGLRFLVAMLAFGALLARLNFHRPLPFLFVIALSVIVPIFANGLRVIGIILIGHWVGNAAAVDSDHVVFGWGFFTVVMLALMGLVRWLGEDPPSAKLAISSATPQPQAAIIGTALAAGFATALGPLIAVFLIATPSGSAPEQPLLAGPADWTSVEADPWNPGWSSMDALWRAAYRQASQPPVEVRVAYFTHQRQGAGVVGYNSRLVTDENARVLREVIRNRPAPDGPATVVQSIVSLPTGTWRVWRWYLVDGEETANALTAKLWQLRSVLPGHSRSAAIILFATPDDGDAEARLAKLAAEFGDRLKVAILRP